MPCSLVGVYGLHLRCTLHMDVVCSSERLANVYKSTRCHILEDQKTAIFIVTGVTRLNLRN